MDGPLTLIILIIIYLIFHLPAIIMLLLGMTILRTRPGRAKKLLIAAGIYFLIGGGICGVLLFGIGR
jgi:hypothetical protein